MKTQLDLSRPQKPAVSSLAGLSLARLQEAVGVLDLPPKQAKMRASQLRRWLHHAGLQSFDEMTNISKEMRHALSEHFTAERPTITDHKVSVDGTQKWLVEFGPNIEGESVFIPNVSKTGALCVSSQVGCTLNCTFCHTGTQRLVRNLTAQEIVAQVLILSLIHI